MRGRNAHRSRTHELLDPIVALVRDVAVAGGTEILSRTDIRIASDDALFGLAEVKWSLFPMGGSSVRLPRQIPYCPRKTSSSRRPSGGPRMPSMP